MEEPRNRFSEQVHPLCLDFCSCETEIKFYCFKSPCWERGKGRCWWYSKQTVILTYTEFDIYYHKQEWKMERKK